GEAVLTLLTVQNSTAVRRVNCLEPDLVIEQLRAVLEDIPPTAAKTGALGNSGIVDAIADAACDFRFPLVVDPVMISKHGTPLVDEEAGGRILRRLIPNAALITPNLHEATALTGIKIRDEGGMRAAIRRFRDMGARSILLKGGHLTGAATDIL